MTPVGVWILVLASMQPLVAYCAMHLVLNVTPSLPVGLYWRVASETLRRGQLVELSVPDAVLPYLQDVPTGAHLLKRVAGVPGDVVCWETEAMAVNGQPVAPRTAQLVFGAVEGCQTLGAQALVVTGSHPTSLDSRHIGPIDRRRVLAQLVPLWTWGARP